LRPFSISRSTPSPSQKSIVYTNPDSQKLHATHMYTHTHTWGLFTLASLADNRCCTSCDLTVIVQNKSKFHSNGTSSRTLYTSHLVPRATVRNQRIHSFYCLLLVKVALLGVIEALPPSSARWRVCRFIRPLCRVADATHVEGNSIKSLDRAIMEIGERDWLKQALCENL
jgi:hypothetical protein